MPNQSCRLSAPWTQCLCCVALLWSLLTGPTFAQDVEDRAFLGYGRLFTNDLLGDGRDRWQTGSLSSSRIWGPVWTGEPPWQFGQLLELRLHGQVISGEELRGPDAFDRPWAGLLSVGAHSHVERSGWEFVAGADVVFVGPQTGLDSLQTAVHDWINAPEPSEAVLDGQIDNRIVPTFVAETARDFGLAPNVHLRPFGEVRAGDETLIRGGADLVVGSFGQAELLVRDPVTGQRYRTIRRDREGASLVLGADTAHVFDSIYLPRDRGIELTDYRNRLRAGLFLQGRRHSVFYGATWLGREFEGQSGSQVVGSVRIVLGF